MKNPSFLKSACHYCARGYVLKAIKIQSVSLSSIDPGLYILPSVYGPVLDIDSEGKVKGFLSKENTNFTLDVSKWLKSELSENGYMDIATAIFTDAYATITDTGYTGLAEYMNG